MAPTFWAPNAPMWMVNVTERAHYVYATSGNRQRAFCHDFSREFAMSNGHRWPVARRSSANTHILRAAINVSPQVPAMTSRVPALTSSVPAVTSPAAVRRHSAHISRLYCGLVVTSRTGKELFDNHVYSSWSEKEKMTTGSDSLTFSNDEETVVCIVRQPKGRN